MFNAARGYKRSFQTSNNYNNNQLNNFHQVHNILGVQREQNLNNTKTTKQILVSTTTSAFAFVSLQNKLQGLLNKEHAEAYKHLELPVDLNNDPNTIIESTFDEGILNYDILLESIILKKRKLLKDDFNIRLSKIGIIGQPIMINPIMAPSINSNCGTKRK